MNKAMVTAIAIASIFVSSLIQTSLAMPGPKISVEPPYLQVSPGEKFTVNITIYPEGEEIFGAQYDLYFDPDLLNATSQTKGTFLSQDGVGTTKIRDKINNTLGKIEYGEIRMSVEHGVATPGVLATITFNAKTPGTSSLNLSDVILSDPGAQPIPGVLVNNGTCDIGTPTPTPTSTPTSTPTPTQTPTPTSGSEDDGNGDASITPTPTPTSTSGSRDNGNGNISITPTSTSCLTPTPTSTETAGLTPTLTPTINHVPSPSPSPSPIVAISPTPAVSLPLSEENNRLPGFEAVFATAGLLVIAYLILKRKEGGDK